MVEIYQDKKKEFRFRVKARNGKIIAISEGYTRKRNCRDGIISLLNNLAGTKIKDLTEESEWNISSHPHTREPFLFKFKTRES